MKNRMGKNQPALRKGVFLLSLIFILVWMVPNVYAASGTSVSTSEEEFGTAPCTVRIDVSNYFKNASVVSIEGEGQTTGAVVDRGYIEFHVEKHGTFTVGDTGKTVASMTLTGKLESVSPEKTAYKGSGNGTKEEPLTILAEFANVASDVKKLQATWKGYNIFAGYDNEGTSPLNGSAVKKVLVEDRDETTGRLLGSFYIDGSLWKATQEGSKGPYYMNYLLNPSDKYITSGYGLDNHYSYTGNADGGEKRRELALKLIKSVRDSKDSALFVQSRLRDYAGPITFKVYTGDLGKFQPGDRISITYLLGSSNRNVYHGIKPSLEELLKDEPTYSKYYQDAGLTLTVDKDGYLTFTLYNGGYFALTKVTGDGKGSNFKMPDFSNTNGRELSKAQEVYFRQTQKADTIG